MRLLSVAVQLIRNPAIMVLDEPTTGLDATSAKLLITTLKGLTESNEDLNFKRKSVILSIHQPRYDIFSSFDDIVLLNGGELVWCGSSDKMLSHFAALGFVCPDHANPADFILDISSIDVRSYT